jgi:hypothetical protein
MHDYWEKFYDAEELEYDDPTTAIAGMLQARELARAENDLQAVFEMNHWILQTMIFRSGDIREAYDLAVQTALESRKPDYAQARTRICVYQDLVLTYFGIDPIGYAEPIQAALNHMQEQATPQMTCRFCMTSLMIHAKLALGEFEKAFEMSQHYLSILEGSWHRRHYATGAYMHLCEIAHHRRDWNALLEYATLALELSENDSDSASDDCVFLAAQALANKQLGGERHTHFYRRATQKAARSKVIIDRRYYNLLADYHLSDGNLKLALKVRERELTHLTDKGRYYWEALCRIHIIQLKRQLTQDVTEDVEAVEPLFAKVKASDVLRQLLEKTLNGD